MRKRQNTDIATKEEILNTSLKLFLENGYEGTSVRMILEKANAVSGSFYYYWDSKEALFEDVVIAFMNKYSEQMNAIAFDDAKPVFERIEAMFSTLEQTVFKYYGNKFNNINIHWTIQYAIHKKTVEALLPAFEHLVLEGIKAGLFVNKLGFDEHSLAIVLLQSIEGLMHSTPLEKADKNLIADIKEKIVTYIDYLLR